MSNIFGTNTTSDLMSVAETAQKIMQGKSLTEDWLEAEMRKVQHKWPRTNPKIKKQWLDKQKARAEKDGMDMSAGGEFEDRLDDYELTIHADDKVWTEASKIKSKWKKMSTAQRTKWLDKIDDLARKQNTSDEDVRAIRDEFGLHMSEEVEVAEAVLDEALKPGDKRVIDAFYDQKEIKAHGASMLTTDGKTLTKRGMGGQDIAKYVNGKIKIVAVSDVKSTEEILRYMKKSIPSGVFEEVEIKEEFWAVIDKAKGGEVMAVSSDEKGAKSSVKMSNFSKHDYHFGKDPRTLKIVKVMGSYKKGEKMIGTKLSFKEEVQIDEKGTAYPATIDTLKMIVKDKQHQTVMFKSGQAIVDTFTASAMVAVYDAMKPATKKKFEAMIKDKGGFMKTQAFAMKMTEDAKWIDQIKEDPSMLELHYSLVQIDEAVHDKKSTFTMAPFEDLRGVADVALKIMQRQPLEVKEEEQEVTSEETPQKLTE